MKISVALAIALTTCNASAAAVRYPVEAEAFLRRIYAPYIAGDDMTNPTGSAAPTIFDTRLTKLIWKDQAQPQGEIGALDANPICDCQDFNHIKLLSIRFLRWDSTKSTASVRFINLGTTSVLIYTLIKSKRGWRVTDIATKHMPSLVEFLQKALRSHR